MTDIDLGNFGMCHKGPAAPPTHTRPKKVKKRPRPPQAKECCAVDRNMSCPSDAPNSNSEGKIGDMNHIMKLFAVLTADSFPSVDSSTTIACFPPDDIDYDYEFAMEG